MLRYWREFAIGALLALALAAWKDRDHALIERGRALEVARKADSTLALVLPMLAKSDTLVVRDTIRVSQRIALVKSDTLWRHDTVHVTGDTTTRIAIPTRSLSSIDSTITACSELTHDCAEFRRNAMTTIEALKTKLAAQPKAEPHSCTASNVGWSLLSAAAGYSAGRADIKIRVPW